MANKCKKVISDAISHLNGYSVILKSKGIPQLAVKDNIKKLKKIKC